MPAYRSRCGHFGYHGCRGCGATPTRPSKSCLSRRSSSCQRHCRTHVSACPRVRALVVYFLLIPGVHGAIKPAAHVKRSQLYDLPTTSSATYSSVDGFYIKHGIACPNICILGLLCVSDVCGVWPQAASCLVSRGRSITCPARAMTRRGWACELDARAAVAAPRGAGRGGARRGATARVTARPRRCSQCARASAMSRTGSNLWKRSGSRFQRAHAARRAPGPIPP